MSGTGTVATCRPPVGVIGKRHRRHIARMVAECTPSFKILAISVEDAPFPVKYATWAALAFDHRSTNNFDPRKRSAWCFFLRVFFGMGSGVMMLSSIFS
jgi:hypothetical protein